MRIFTTIALTGLLSVYGFSPSSLHHHHQSQRTSHLSATVDNTNGATNIYGNFQPVTVERSSTTPTVAAVPKLAQRWRKSTKQLATLGPASSTKEMIEKLFLAGADVFRLNFSHGSQEQKKELLSIIREVEEKYSHPIAVLGDLQGPKLRVSQKPSCDYSK